MTEDNSHAGQGAVLLDIGGDIGALIVTAPAAMEGIEIEIRPVGGADPDHHDHGQGHDAHDHGDRGHSHFVHVAVVGRPVNGEIHYTAVYPELSTGTYELYVRPAEPVALTVEVTGGQVTEARWPSA